MRTAGTFFLAVILVGCAPTNILHGQGDLWDGDYRGVSVIFTRTAEGARSLCGSAGLDLARAEGVLFAEGRAALFGGVSGCFSPE